MTIAQISALLLQVHEGMSAVEQAAFDYYEPGGGDDKVCWAAKIINGVTFILLPGSKSWIDWVRDLDAWANPVEHSTLGPVQPGMFLGVEQAWVEIQARTKPPWVLTGHSLGAARSAYIAAFMTLAKLSVLGRVPFGEPKPGFRPLANIIAKVPQWGYRNGDAHGHDLVTDYPLLLPPEDYVHPSPLIEVTARPSLVDELETGVFCWHHMALYAKATSALTTVVM